jgi:phage repressor protein C with HTH and peptisase S24 domain
VGVRGLEDPVRRTPLQSSLQAPAGDFGDGHEVEAEGWIDVSAAASLGELDESMFVSQIVGHSMEPRIPDRSYCIRRVRAGTRRGKIVLAQHQDIAEMDSGDGHRSGR